MKILIFASAFRPMIGGYEHMAELIAKGLSANGHLVKVITQARAVHDDQGKQDNNGTFDVIRCPSFSTWYATLKWADVYLCFNVSIKALVPWVICHRPLIVSHQGWYSDLTKPVTLNARFKLLLTHFATNVACSRAVANYLPSDSITIPNSFDCDLFKHRPEVPRVKDVLFVGRLVSDKGCSLLIEALRSLADTGLYPSTTIAGEGPEMSKLKAHVLELDMQNQIQFVGAKRGRELAELMNSHKILAVPSVWPEPFGIVALEGAGAGCIVIGSSEGGLGEAIGPCGIAVPNRQSGPLAEAIRKVLIGDESSLPKSDAVVAHLARHLPQNVTLAYENVLNAKIRT